MSVKHYAVLYEETGWETDSQPDLKGREFSFDENTHATGEADGERFFVHRIPFTQGQTVAQAVYLSGIFASPPLCSGMGRCGYCRVGLWRCIEDGYQSVFPTPQEQEYFQKIGLDNCAQGTKSSCFANVNLTISAQRLARLNQLIFAEEALQGRGENSEKLVSQARLETQGINEGLGDSGGFARPHEKKGDSSPVMSDSSLSSTIRPSLFSPLEAGWRLGCQHTACAGDVVLLPENVTLLSEVSLAEESHVACEDDALCKTTISHIAGEGVDWLALDMGTTSVHWAAYTHEKVDGGSFSNPQMGAGSDVVSRIQASLTPNGGKRLASLSQNMLRSLARQIGGAKAVVLAANPAMTSIFLGQDVTSLAHAPYALPDSGGDWVHVKDLPPLWICPHISPFVGGDISAGYASLVQEQREFPFLLADMGTNGEFILALSPEEAFATSVALGPALEGINLSFGSAAKEGVVVDFTVSPLALEPVWYSPTEPCPNKCTPAKSSPDTSSLDKGRARQDSSGEYSFNTGTKNELFQGKTSATSSSRSLEAQRNQLGSVPDLPSHRPVLSAPAEQMVELAKGEVKMSGTAYISLLSQLIDGRAMTRQGQFVAGGGSFARLLRHASSQPPQGAGSGMEPFFPLPHAMKLYASDVEEIIKVKAAFSLGLKRLLAHAGLEFHEIRRVYLAGALGHNVQTLALENLGFFPPGAHERILPVGNSALAGAVKLAQDEGLREWLVAWTKMVKSVNLAEDLTFAEGFLGHMKFEW